MRAKYINEKFSEESDPVEDMGIGIGGMVEDYKKKVIKEKGWTRGQSPKDLDTVKYLLEDMGVGWEASKLSDKDFDLYFQMVEYVLKHRNVDINTPGTNIFRNAVRMKGPLEKRLRIMKLLITYGLKIKSLDEFIRGDNTPDDNKILILLAKAGVMQRKPKFQQTFINNVLGWSSNYSWGNDSKYTVNTTLTKWALENGADPSHKNYLSLRSALEHDNVELVKIFMKYLQDDPKYK